MLTVWYVMHGMLCVMCYVCDMLHVQCVVCGVACMVCYACGVLTMRCVICGMLCMQYINHVICYICGVLYIWYVNCVVRYVCATLHMYLFILGCCVTYMVCCVQRVMYVVCYTCCMCSTCTPLALRENGFHVCFMSTLTSKAPTHLAGAADIREAMSDCRGTLPALPGVPFPDKLRTTVNP